MTVDDRTTRDVRPISKGPVSPWARRFGTLLLLLVVLAGALGLFGVRSRSTSVTSNGWSLTVTYPQVARAGLDVPWRALVRHGGGLPPKITIAVSTDYFRMFETQGFYPEADSMTNDGRFVYFTFDTPPGDSFLVDYDAYIQPSSQIGKRADVELIVNGQTVAAASIHTWLLP